MSDVILTIGGRDYSVACAPGEESHIAELGRMIDGKLGTLPGAAGKNAGRNDSRSLLFAALLLADELYELRGADHRTPAAPIAPAPGTIVSPDRLEALAERLEALADTLDVPS